MSIRKIIAVLLGLMGLVWFLQGVGLFTMIDSFMNYDPRWAVAGVVMVIVAILLWGRQEE